MNDQPQSVPCPQCSAPVPVPVGVKPGQEVTCTSCSTTFPAPQPKPQPNTYDLAPDLPTPPEPTPPPEPQTPPSPLLGPAFTPTPQTATTPTQQSADTFSLAPEPPTPSPPPTPTPTPTPADVFDVAPDVQQQPAPPPDKGVYDVAPDVFDVAPDRPQQPEPAPQPPKRRPRLRLLPDGTEVADLGADDEIDRQPAPEPVPFAEPTPQERAEYDTKESKRRDALPELAGTDEVIPPTLTKGDELGKKHDDVEPEEKDGEKWGAGEGDGDAPSVGGALLGLPVLGDIAKAVQPFVQSLGRFGALFGGGKGEGEGEGDKAEGGKTEDGKTEGEGGEGEPLTAKAALGAIAQVATSVVESFTTLVGVTSSFVQALNPSLLQMLGRTVHDLNAVIGQAFVPLIQQASSSARFLADALLQPMKELRPVVSMIAGTFGKLLNTMSQGLGEGLVALTPVLKVAAQLFDMVGVTLRVMVNGVRAVVSVLAPFVQAFSGILGAVLTPFRWMGSVVNEVARAVAALGAGLGNALSSIVSAIGKQFGGAGGVFSSLGSTVAGLVRGLIKLTLGTAALAAKFFGFDGAVKAMIDSLAGPEQGKSVGMGAASQAQVTSIESWSRGLMAAAFTAQPVGPADKEPDAMSDVIGLLKEIKGGNANLGDVIKRALGDAAPAFIDALKARMPTPGAAAAYVGGSILHTGYDRTLGWNGLGGAIGDAANWAAGLPAVK